MTHPQLLILAILAATGALFLFGRWRHDLVSLTSLLACVLAGLVPAAQAFAGFGHPAVVTVACVLVLSHALQVTGAVDALARRVLPRSAGPLASIAALTGLGALLSAFMNNVGALALLMPVGLQLAAQQGMPAGRVLMPLAFGSILGGMTTLIGTPPNLIVSGFRAREGQGTFALFDFTPVGLAVAGAGLAFVILAGRWLVPARERAGAESFETGAYLTEARVPEGSRAEGRTLREIGHDFEAADAQVVGWIRGDVRITAPNAARKVRAGDILVIEAEPEALRTVLSSLRLRLEEDVRKDDQAEDGQDAPANGPARAQPDATDPPERRGDADSDEVALVELVVLPDSGLAGRSASHIRLRTRYGINLLAVSRQGNRSLARLRSMLLREGDVLLMQGAPEAVLAFAAEFGCVPLAQRDLRLPERRQALLAGGIMAAAVGAAALGLTSAPVAFAAGVLALLALKVVPLGSVYHAIDGSVVVLLAGLIPVAGALATTGAADLLAGVLLEQVVQGHAVLALAAILVLTMTLSDFMNNAATAALMCPVAIGAAERLGVSADPFLMAVAVGASCAFLTPIGHQNNTLILGPGGFHFGDYWRLGLPLEIIVTAVAVPMLLLVWPL